MAKTNTKQTENQAPASELATLIDARDKLSKQILDIEGKENPSEVERFAVEGMRTKLAEFDKQIGPQMEASTIAKLFDAAVSITKEALVSEDVEYVVKLKADGSDPEVGRLKGRAKRKLAGEKQQERVYDWKVDGKGLSDGASDILKDLSNKVVLLTGEYKIEDIKGIAARLNWKVAHALGPVVLHMQGKKLGDKKFGPHNLTLSNGKEVEVPDVTSKMYAHKHGLIELSKDRNSAAVKDAIAAIRDRLNDAMKEDGSLPDGGKKVGVNELIEYIHAQHKIASQCHAETVG